MSRRLWGVLPAELLVATVLWAFLTTLSSAAVTLKYDGSYTPSGGPIQPFTFQALSTNVMLRPDIVRLAVTPFLITDGTQSWTMTDGLGRVRQ